MANRRTAAPVQLPAFVRRLASDEYAAPPLSERDQHVRAAVRERGVASAARLALAPGAYWASRRGTAAGLRALNAAAGRKWYRVPAEAELDADAADACLGGDEVVIDVQTHFVADRPECARWNRTLRALYASVAPEWWHGLDDVTAYDMTAWLRCVFGESETAAAVLTSAPGTGPDRMLHDRELAGVRALFERLGGGGRLFNHCVVQPERRGGIEAMRAAHERFAPIGWKVYTLGGGSADDPAPGGWFLDDETTGVPFLEQVRASGVRRVCAHKGISGLVPTGSPRDVGPAAAAFPDLEFLIYHSGYEIPASAAPEEGPYSDAAAHVGTNRLVASLHGAGIGPGANVFAELGSTWFCLIRRPEEAAHVLGKLLLAVGEDNVLWGTDAIWYGSPQPAIDAFRAFQIPADLRDRYGYPELTPQVKAKVLGRNAARIYGLDLERARAARDDLSWLRPLMDEVAARGVPEVD
ncbi:MAG TPA: amidohydrolase family protein [Myxococcota bacterium]|nr:amidohydrolase family protein [Myxococcota bacterium]